MRFRVCKLLISRGLILFARPILHQLSHWGQLLMSSNVPTSRWPVPWLHRFEKTCVLVADGIAR
jgi:hypothetical protein